MRRSSRRQPQNLVVTLVVGAILLIAALWSLYAERGTIPPASQPQLERASTLATIRISQLPVEAQATLTLIEQDGPFPFEKDGNIFQNRERLLPAKPGGYYREYTVITPGSDDRGARRIVAGQGGERYYTDDHYDSFREIIS